MTSKEQYRSICKERKDIPIFLQDWWLDLVCAGNWEAVIYEEKNNILGILPYYRKKKKLFSGIGMPPLTHYMGYWLFYPDVQKYSSRLSFEKKVITALLKQLPTLDFFEQLIAPLHVNGLPLYWQGYSQTMYYTYVIEDISSSDQVHKNFASNVRGHLKKASQTIEVHTSDDTTILFELLQKTFAKKKMAMPYAKELLEELHQQSKAKEVGKLYTARDKHGQYHSALYILMDESSDTAYNILRATDPNYVQSGATSLLIWTALQDLKSSVKSFDFVGSYIPSIERFLRDFGTTQKPYFFVQKENSILYQTLKRLKR